MARPQCLPPCPCPLPQGRSGHSCSYAVLPCIAVMPLRAPTPFHTACKMMPCPAFSLQRQQRASCLAAPAWAGQHTSLTGTAYGEVYRYFLFPCPHVRQLSVPGCIPPGRAAATCHSHTITELLSRRRFFGPLLAPHTFFTARMRFPVSFGEAKEDGAGIYWRDVLAARYGVEAFRLIIILMQARMQRSASFDDILHQLVTEG